ncbi:MAG TPA: LuxR C-terminal-related transcriptional regulator [Gemmatimonadaceae bacterium]
MRSCSPRAERDALRGIRRACDSAFDSATLRRAIAAHASRVIPSDAHFLNALDPDTGLLTHVMGNGTAGLLDTFLGSLYPGGEAERVIALAQSGRVVTTQSSPRFASALREFGFRHEVRATFAVDDEPWGLWCALRAPGAPPFGDRETTFLRRIAPWVARGLRSAALLAAAAHADPGSAGAGACTMPGVLVIDSRGHVTQRTGMAAAQLADLADEMGTTAELPSPILGVLARQRVACLAGAAHTDELRVHGRSGRWYAIRAALTEPDAGGCSSSVVIITPLARAEVAPLLARLYGLSPREREVVSLAARGHATKSIAARMGISAYTVQDHLDHASERVGVRGRRALLAKLFFDGYAEELERASL